MVQRAIQKSTWGDYRWVPLEAIAPEAALAVVAAEDQKFPDHPGFDVDAITAALRHNSKGGSVRGASTISQQVAKNLFLWEGRSWLRKGLEAWYTGWIAIRPTSTPPGSTSAARAFTAPCRSTCSTQYTCRLRRTW